MVHFWVTFMGHPPHPSRSIWAAKRVTHGLTPMCMLYIISLSEFHKLQADPTCMVMCENTFVLSFAASPGKQVNECQRQNERMKLDKVFSEQSWVFFHGIQVNFSKCDLHKEGKCLKYLHNGDAVRLRPTHWLRPKKGVNLICQVVYIVNRKLPPMRPALFRIM